ncbi:hypothetical protein CRYUN_Cryun24cG0006500 [Craigia yunnanensis]
MCSDIIGLSVNIIREHGSLRVIASIRKLGEVHSSLPSLEPLSTIQEESSSESEEVEDVADDQDTVQPSAPGIISSRKRGHKGIGDAIASAILEMAAASKLRSAAVKQCNARYSIASCIKELDEMQAVEERVYFVALELFNNADASEKFLSLKGDKRLTWLHRKCVAPSNTPVR